jgi:hypothetical protein
LRNLLQAGFVERAQDWRWSSARQAGEGMPALDAGPVARPDSWLQHVNEPQTEAEVGRLRLSSATGRLPARSSADFGPGDGLDLPGVVLGRTALDLSHGGFVEGFWIDFIKACNQRLNKLYLRRARQRPGRLKKLLRDGTHFL